MSTVKTKQEFRLKNHIRCAGFCAHSIKEVCDLLQNQRVSFSMWPEREEPIIVIKGVDAALLANTNYNMKTYLIIDNLLQLRGIGVPLVGIHKMTMGRYIKIPFKWTDKTARTIELRNTMMAHVMRVMALKYRNQLIKAKKEGQ